MGKNLLVAFNIDVGPVLGHLSNLPLIGQADFSIFETAKGVAGPFSLAAFAIAAVFGYMRYRAAQKTKMLRLIPDDQRLDAAQLVLDQLHVDPAGLTKEQRYNLAMRMLQDKQRRYIALVALTGILGISSLALWAYAIPSAPSAISEDLSKLTVSEIAMRLEGSSGSNAKSILGELEKRSRQEAGKVIDVWGKVGLAHQEDTVREVSLRGLLDRIGSNEEGKLAVEYVGRRYLDLLPDNPNKRMIDEQFTLQWSKGDQMFRTILSDQNAPEATSRYLAVFLGRKARSQQVAATDLLKHISDTLPVGTNPQRECKAQLDQLTR